MGRKLKSTVDGRVHIRIDPELKLWFQEYCARKKSTATQFITNILEEQRRRDQTTYTMDAPEDPTVINISTKRPKP